MIYIVGPGALGVEERDVGGRAYSRGVRGSRFSTRSGPVVNSSTMRSQRDFSRMHQTFQSNADGGFEAEDAERALFEFLHFFAAGVRSMIGGDGVDGAADDAVGDGCDVAGGAQRRLHFVIAVVGRHLAVGQREMMRRGFAGDGEAARFGERHHFDRVPRRDMGHVESRAGELGEQDIARHHHILGRGRNAAQSKAHALDAFVHVAAGAQVQILAMIDHREAEGARGFHGAAHDARIHDGPAIVGDGDDARLLHQADGGQLFAGAAFGDGADGKYIDDGVALGALDDVAGDGGVVVDWRRVRHAADGGEPTGGGGARAGFDGLGVFEAGLAQMDVHVDKAGRDDQAGRVEFGGSGGFKILADGGDAAVFDRRRRDRVQMTGGVDHAAVADDQLSHGSVLTNAFQHRHAHRDSIFHLIQDHGALASRRLRTIFRGRG